MVTVERISDPARLPAVAQQWDELIDESTPGAVFRSSAWLLPWWRWFSHGKELAIYAATDSSRLIGVLPAYHAKSPLGGRRLRLLGDGTVASDYLGVIARPNQLEAAAESIARAVLAEERELLLDGVMADDPLIAALRRRCGTFSARPDECPYVPIKALPDFGIWIRSRPQGLSEQLNRRRRWLAKRPGFRIETLTGQEQVTAALPTLWALHRARWSIDGGTSALPAPEVEQFHADSARALAARGWVRLYLLYADGAPRAALYGFERGGRFLYYQGGNDPEWRRRSVGTVVFCAALEDAFTRGLDEFDLLRGAEQYKALYASSSRPIVTFRVAADARARALWFADRARRLAEGAAGALPTPVRKRLAAAVDRTASRRPDLGSSLRPAWTRRDGVAGTAARRRG